MNQRSGEKVGAELLKSLWLHIAAGYPGHTSVYRWRHPGPVAEVTHKATEMVGMQKQMAALTTYMATLTVAVNASNFSVCCYHRRFVNQEPEYTGTCRFLRHEKTRFSGKRRNIYPKDSNTSECTTLLARPIFWWTQTQMSQRFPSPDPINCSRNS